MTTSLAFVSKLRAPRAAVWAEISTMRGVNAELAPFLRMTSPKARDRLDGDVPLGEPLFRAWLLLFGVVPIDYDDLVLAELVPGHGFVETSTMLTQRTWRHARWLEDDALGCVLMDEITFEPRLAVLTPVARRVVRAVFTHRHRRLRARFGGEPAQI